MNLRPEIRSDLWQAISKPYESEIYSSAVLEAIHYLSNLLRERANVDGDGIPLVGQALGGDSPRLRINKFQTETEKNEQKGLEQILRGLYQGIRNPRSHEQYEDEKDTADAIILFVNYIIGIIGQAKEPFTLDDWCNRVFDPDFVASDRYAKLLANEVPPQKYNEALITIYRKKTSGNGDNLKYIFHALIGLAGDDKIDDFLAVISDELKTVNQDKVIRVTLQILPERLWPRINEIARLRIENKLIRSIASGRYDNLSEKCIEGGFGTWGIRFLRYFSLKYELCKTFLDKLQKTQEEQNYVAKYFYSSLPKVIDSIGGEKFWSEYWRESITEAIVKAVSDSLGAVVLRDKFLERYEFPSEWQDLILKEIEKVKGFDPEFFDKYINPEEIPF
ncbi:MAG: TIGR02391 family protein [Anaerolineales bacterium]|nr:TIGR02391 family protein [Anaerolineales bacterium]